MPGAPNKPPAPAEVPVLPTARSDPVERKLVRRLAPFRVALRLDLWKGSPHPDLTTPLLKAEAAFAQGDYPTTQTHLDQLAVRFHEPRWPTIPEPFRSLRVEIPAPQPPAWDPDAAATPEERGRRKDRREAEFQLALAEGTVQWAAGHGVDLGAAAGPIGPARVELQAHGATDAFYAPIDALWAAVRTQVPLPSAPATKPPPGPA
ncbi:MAG: hypothetical protein ACYCPV_06560 [Thermoplasmata archaeon]|jgi:hypothetical protein